MYQNALKATQYDILYICIAVMLSESKCDYVWRPRDSEVVAYSTQLPFISVEAAAWG